MDFDASWCTVCDKLIAPKRYQVPIEQPPPPAPAPPPSSPQPSRKYPAPSSHPRALINTAHLAPSKAKKTKANPRKPGLVSGTGRLRTNGTVKAPPPAPQPAQPIRYRTVIDQSPQGLYCSDDCRIADLNSIHRGLPVYPDRDVRPALARPPSPSTSSSSESSTSSGSKSYPDHVQKMAKQFGFPPLPDLNTIYHDDSTDEDCYGGPDEYTGGIMMANKRIEAVIPGPRKQPTTRWEEPQPLPKPIPGWTDGSNAWRASVYGFTNPPAAKTDNFKTIRPARQARRTSTCALYTVADPTEDLYTQFSEALTRRTESRLSSPSPSSSSTTSCSAPKRERSLLRPGAEGKLLVPDVKLKVRSSSSASLSSMSPSSRRSVRSPLSTSSTFSEDAPPKRPTVETRSWSYDNVLTYPIMEHPKNIVKRKEKRIVDGEEVEVEIEVELPPKKLFLFPPSVRPINQRS
ncbi:hypothetical protein MD484_g1235, partial [Candolleomyces efflorescens]